jgi:hypothetical protein
MEESNAAAQAQPKSQDDYGFGLNEDNLETRLEGKFGVEVEPGIHRRVDALGVGHVDISMLPEDERVASKLARNVGLSGLAGTASFALLCAFSLPLSMCVLFLLFEWEALFPLSVLVSPLLSSPLLYSTMCVCVCVYMCVCDLLVLLLTKLVVCLCSSNATTSAWLEERCVPLWRNLALHHGRFVCCRMHVAVLGCGVPRPSRAFILVSN